MPNKDTGMLNLMPEEHTTYPISKNEVAEVQNKHTYHAPNEDQIARYPQIREKAQELELLIRRLCPPSRERSVAITQIETGVFWANASIARNEHWPDDPDFSGEDH